MVGPIESIGQNAAGVGTTNISPEIDGVVHLPDVTEFRPGDLVEAEITSADDYDLWVS